MKKVQNGTTVHISCEAKLEDGTLCFKNDKENPLELVMGEGKMFPAVEQALHEMQEGQSETITL